MPLTRRVKMMMLTESAISATTVLLVAARAVDMSSADWHAAADSLHAEPAAMSGAQDAAASLPNLVKDAVITVLGTRSSAFRSDAGGAPAGGDVSTAKGLCCVLVGERLAVNQERL